MAISARAGRSRTSYLSAMHWPEAFEAEMSHILGTELGSFKETLASSPPVSIRHNPSKPFAHRRTADAVPWCAEGEYLSERPVFTLDPLFHGGAYYVQEASSMFIGWMVQQLDLPESPRALLDLCAAPGGKSTHLASLLRPEDVLVCNEIHPQRALILEENLVRWGSARTLATRTAPHQLADRWPERFDLVLVDAPCSGEGMFRKDPAAIGEWSPALVERCTLRQREILDHALRMLAPGGHLIYSTCTWNEAEDERQMRQLMQRYPLEVVSPEVDPTWGVVASEPGWRFYPHRLRGEGLYSCVFRKTSPLPDTQGKRRDTALPIITERPHGALIDYLDSKHDPQVFEGRDGSVQALPKALLDHHGDLASDRVLSRRGVRAGAWKGKDLFIPDHELALNELLDSRVPAMDLHEEDAVRYLRKETMPIEDNPSGMKLVRFQGCPLGWAKYIPGRVNNLLPHHLRIRI